MAKLRWKRWLYLTHRWAGIALCVLFAAWFVSGVVMMYVGFPQLDRDERLRGLPALDFSRATLTPAAAIARLHDGDFAAIGAPDANLPREIADANAPITPQSVRLGMLQQRPVYRVEIRGAQPRAIFADNGELLREVTPQQAVDIATDFARRSGAFGVLPAVHYEELRQTEQWTLSGNLNAHRPLHRVALGDDAGTELYVSSTTGEVVRDTARFERALNYIGAVTHWIYPTVIRRHPDLWVWTVDILATAGVVLAFSGLWIGVLRWNFKRRPGKPAVPYRGLMRWHYFTGIFFGICTLTWVFSGWMSMNPGGFNLPRNPTPVERAIFSGVEEGIRATDFNAMVPAFADDIVDAELLHYDGGPRYLATLRGGMRQLIETESGTLAHIDRNHLLSMAPRLLPSASMKRVQILDGYDNYYYSRHPERGDKPLPVLRVEFDDDAATWFHIDVLSGQVLERSTTINRVYRWIYNGLHSWDIWWLWQHRPLWDIAVISFSLGGLLLSALGVVVGWRRLRFNGRQARV